MRDVKYLLIGGGVASYQAAKQIRKADPEGSVLLIGGEPLPPYDRTAVSKQYLTGKKSVGEIVYETPEVLAGERIEVMLTRRIEALDPATLSARLAGGEQIHFEKALLATGGRPIRLRLPGADLPGVHYLRDAADAAALAADARSASCAVVIGGGFIGLEVAASLRQMGLDVTVIEALPHVWARFSNETLSDYVRSYCSDRGVRFLTSAQVSEFRGNGHLESLVTVAGEVIPCQVVCIGVGIVPNVELATGAGLAIDNGVRVNERLKTSHPAIYAAGDVINYFDPLFGKRRRVEHWGHAEYTGQIAGRNMAGGSYDYDFLSYVWSDIFEMHLEFAGDESEHDKALLRGSPNTGSFTIMYVKGGAITAFFAVNVSPREFPVIRQLIRHRKDISGLEPQLQDIDYNLRQLV